MKFELIDLIVFSLYCAIVIGLGLWVSREKKGVKKNSNDYFLASNALPWWAVGSSIIASNISAEQFIGMSGSGFRMGMAIATYELMAAFTLIIVAVVFLPIFIKKKVYTMPQFLEQRFDLRVKTILAVFWLLVFVFVNLTSILYLGSLAIKNMMGLELVWGILGLALFSAVYSIYGGLKAVAWTDVIQIVFLIGGGLVTTYVAFELLGYGDFFAGVKDFWIKVGPGSADNKFDMILSKDNEFYKQLPGIGVLIGGMWVANLYYWGCNQYIIQRALAAKNIDQAQKGLVFAGFLKLLLPLIVVVPGIIAYVLFKEGRIAITVADDAYPTLLSLVPVGVKGLAFAALVAAIVSSLASMMNSIATIFTMDIFKVFIKRDASETALVKTGRITSIVALLIAIVVAPLLGNLDQAFQFIQEFTGFVSPGALAIFLAAFFYKKATANGALAAAASSFILSGAFKFLFPAIPFLDRMGYVFLLCLLIIVVVGIVWPKPNVDKEIVLDKELFRTSFLFKLGAVLIAMILVLIYTVWW
ncbi:MAG: sodium/glucose cotransporter [Bacteroidetes bacterium GWF2_40_14]|nr:MAG: sodium/glucose cotransporter [Bacteroidetes bacterium GWF2_40_14]